ncbi:MAG: cytochrome C oxidase subunit IV family protein [Chloroflexi bacterium]|nr:cytochrome C oxidase subunit IV family protein [Chloroflexota bacterium]
MAGRVREAAHPTPLTYAKVAALLGAITGIEVGIFYMEAIKDALVGMFIVLSAVKFALVAMFYMHLRFDSRLFSGFFVGGLMLAASIILALMALFQVFVDSSSTEAADTTSGESLVSGPVDTHQIGTVGNQLQFSKSSLSAKKGEEVVLKFNNGANTQQHNWVLVPTGTKDEIATAGLAAGPGSGWVPEDARIIAHTELIGPGESGEVQFTAPAAGTYQFVCTFPGHSATMFGTFEITP